MPAVMLQSRLQVRAGIRKGETTMSNEKQMGQLTRTDELETLYDLTIDLAGDLASGAIDHADFEDSRGRLDTLIDWANEFNARHAATDWAEVEYLDTIIDFYAEKTKPYRKPVSKPSAANNLRR
jgi:hypothetical protein